jgi:hypothetical protein
LRYAHRAFVLRIEPLRVSPLRASITYRGSTHMTASFTPGPWHVCQHLKSMECDQACSCGYRGVIYGPGDDDKAICQPGHELPPKGVEGTEPGRYPREVEIANAHLIAAAPCLYAALASLFADYKQLADSGDAGNWALEDTEVGKQALAALALAQCGAHPQGGDGTAPFMSDTVPAKQGCAQ